MTDLKAQIEALTKTFAGDVAAMLTSRTVDFADSVVAIVNTHIIEGISGVSASVKTLAKQVVVNAGSHVTQRASQDTKRNPGPKRPRADVTVIKEKLYAFIKERPGERIEVIGPAINYGTEELKLPMSKLRDEGRVETKGKLRATCYWPKAVTAKKK